MNQEEEFAAFISGLANKPPPNCTDEISNHIGLKDGNFEEQVVHDGPVNNNDVAQDTGSRDSDGSSNGKRKLEESNGDAANNEDANSDSESPNKKQALETDIRKMLPDLEKHWKPVEDDPSDFNSWTYLLQYVDQENSLPPGREAYDAFLARYSYCYGYWKKYADFEKRNGTPEECEQVFERGLKAIPLSVDLWIHYLNYVKTTKESDHDFIRSQFQRGMAACGLEFRSDKLWEHYIHWEKEVNNLRNVLAIYDQIIQIPTQSHMTHFQNLKGFVEENVPQDILSMEELAEMKSNLDPTAEEAMNELENRLREKILEKRTEVYKKNEEQVNARWSYEEAIKRPYFHVKPLEKGQLRMWREYLDFEIERGDEKRIYILFERCLIACALYEEYWLKYITYLQSKSNKDTELIRDVFVRGCTIYHHNNLWLNLYWCAFEESLGNMDRVNELFDKLENTIKNSLHVYFKRIHFERRCGNFQRCEELFQKYIEETKGKITSIHLTIKYAYFLQYYLHNMKKAVDVLQNTETEDEKLQATILMALVDLGFRERDASLVSSTFQKILDGKISPEIKVNFAHRNLEFMEETASDVDSILKAHDQLQKLVQLVPPKQPEETPPAVSAAAGPATKDVKAEAVAYQASAPQAAVPPPTTEQYNGTAYNQYGSYGSSGWDQQSQQYPAAASGTPDYYSQQYYQGYYG